jgi:CheY-like chemotaxis protein
MASVSPRVLVVEDEMLPAMMLESMLTGLGCAVIGPAARLGKALELLRTAAPDAVILDVNLGGQPAYPLAAALRAKGVPFVFVTGYGRAQLPAEWRATPLLAKPFTQAQLAAAVAALLATPAAAAH